MSAKDKYIISPAHTASPTHSTVDTFTALPSLFCRHTQHRLHAAHSTAYTYTALTTYIHTYIQQRLHTALPIHTLIQHCLHNHSSSIKYVDTDFQPSTLLLPRSRVRKLRILFSLYHLYNNILKECP